ncbi:hypothetical protein GGX14DRAFT_562061 [Mycena pura]|uniref:Uncharacterized protein n=1 Tax=Mycena pura TaxID=153505 RepID=A0AAD6VPR6_9AGAR|nr:hypothetical protein GGX14DRAFT_562061 [Mycena pura]
MGIDRRAALIIISLSRSGGPKGRPPEASLSRPIFGHATVACAPSPMPGNLAPAPHLVATKGIATHHSLNHRDQTPRAKARSANVDPPPLPAPSPRPSDFDVTPCPTHVTHHTRNAKRTLNAHWPQASPPRRHTISIRLSPSRLFSSGIEEFEFEAACGDVAVRILGIATNIIMTRSERIFVRVISRMSRVPRAACGALAYLRRAREAPSSLD